LKPYQSLHGLRTAIDNGGRFYNFFSKAEDQFVNPGELAKAAGVFTAGMKAFLFLEMAQQELSAADRQSVADLLDSDLRKRYLRYRPKTMLPSDVEKNGKGGESLIVTGYARFVEDRRRITGLIVVPAGKVMVMIPITDKFNIYEVFNDRSMREPHSLVASVRRYRIDHDGPIRFGGVLRKLTFKDKTNKSHKFYLETTFYTKLPRVDDK
jgi:hypothetical protein